MNHYSFFYILICSFFLFSCGGDKNAESIVVIADQKNNPGSGDNDELVWSEEFDYEGSPDSSIWTIEQGDGCPNLCGWGNSEKQFYKAENIEVSDGTLKINIKKESYGGKSFTSGRMKSQGKYNFTYGKADIKAKLPKNAGTWPALWLLGESISFYSWPKCGEIDIMEQRGDNKSVVLGTCHWGEDWDSRNQFSQNSPSVDGLTNDWHIYSVNWSDTSIKIYIDDTLYYTMNIDQSHPFNDPFFFVLNVAVGGTLGGDIPFNFPDDVMEIDYIRVYQ